MIEQKISLVEDLLTAQTLEVAHFSHGALLVLQVLLNDNQSRSRPMSFPQTLGRKHRFSLKRPHMGIFVLALQPSQPVSPGTGLKCVMFSMLPVSR